MSAASIAVGSVVPVASAPSSVGSAKSVESMESMESVRSAKSVESMESVHSAKSVESMESMESVHSAKSMKSVVPIESAVHVVSAAPAAVVTATSGVSPEAAVSAATLVLAVAHAHARNTQAISLSELQTMGATKRFKGSAPCVVKTFPASSGIFEDGVFATRNITARSTIYSDERPWVVVETRKDAKGVIQDAQLLAALRAERQTQGDAAFIHLFHEYNRPSSATASRNENATNAPTHLTNRALFSLLQHLGIKATPFYHDANTHNHPARASDEQNRMLNALLVQASFPVFSGVEFVATVVPKSPELQRLNHACQPNCRLQLISDDRRHCVSLVAVRDIKDDEELTINYSTSPFDFFPLEIAKDRHRRADQERKEMKASKLPMMFELDSGWRAPTRTWFSCRCELCRTEPRTKQRTQRDTAAWKATGRGGPASRWRPQISSTSASVGKPTETEANNLRQEASILATMAASSSFRETPSAVLPFFWRFVLFADRFCEAQNIDFLTLCGRAPIEQSRWTNLCVFVFGHEASVEPKKFCSDLVVSLFEKTAIDCRTELVASLVSCVASSSDVSMAEWKQKEHFPLFVANVYWPIAFWRCVLCALSKFSNGASNQDQNKDKHWNVFEGSRTVLDQMDTWLNVARFVCPVLLDLVRSEMISLTTEGIAQNRAPDPLLDSWMKKLMIGVQEKDVYSV